MTRGRPAAVRGAAGVERGPAAGREAAAVGSGGGRGTARPRAPGARAASVPPALPFLNMAVRGRRFPSLGQSASRRGGSRSAASQWERGEGGAAATAAARGEISGRCGRSGAGIGIGIRVGPGAAGGDGPQRRHHESQEQEADPGGEAQRPARAEGLAGLDPSQLLRDLPSQPHRLQGASGGGERGAEGKEGDGEWEGGNGEWRWGNWEWRGARPSESCGERGRDMRGTAGAEGAVVGARLEGQGALRRQGWRGRLRGLRMPEVKGELWDV